MRKDPVFHEIDKKQEALNDENRLISKNKPAKPLVIGTSMILVTGVLIGLVRILIVSFN